MASPVEAMPQALPDAQPEDALADARQPDAEQAMPAPEPIAAQHAPADGLESGVDESGRMRLEPSFEPRFVRQARRRERWQRPWVRALLGGLALLLLACGALQGAWIWRDRLAVRWPALRPALARMCAVGGCRVAPPRRPQDLVIDASSMSPAGPSRLQLDISLRNRGDAAVAYPWLQLGLGSGGDAEQVLARKVIPPEDYLRALGLDPAAIQDRLRQGLPSGGALHLRLQLGSQAPAAGSYTVYLFYP